jgi:hypothetical protein
MRMVSFQYDMLVTMRWERYFAQFLFHALDCVIRESWHPLHGAIKAIIVIPPK